MTTEEDAFFSSTTESELELAIQASALMREAMVLIRQMAPRPPLADAVALLCAAADALGEWKPNA